MTFWRTTLSAGWLIVAGSGCGYGCGRDFAGDHEGTAQGRYTQGITSTKLDAPSVRVVVTREGDVHTMTVQGCRLENGRKSSPDSSAVEFPRQTCTFDVPDHGRHTIDVVHAQLGSRTRAPVHRIEAVDVNLGADVTDTTPRGTLSYSVLVPYP